MHAVEREGREESSPYVGEGGRKVNGFGSGRNKEKIETHKSGEMEGGREGKGERCLTKIFLKTREGGGVRGREGGGKIERFFDN